MAVFIFFMKVDLWPRQVVERQLNHNMTFRVPVQKFISLGVKFEILVTKGSPSYSKSRTNGRLDFRGSFVSGLPLPSLGGGARTHFPNSGW